MNRPISIFVVLLALVSFALTKEPLSQPSQIIEVFRHGARGPLSGYDSSWPWGLWGALTPAGKRQQYVLGKFNSEKYPHLLGSDANHSEIYMLSDVTKRCIESAQIQLAGMYGGNVPSLKNTHPVETAIPPFEGSEILKVASSVEQLPMNLNAPSPVDVKVVNETQKRLFKRTHGEQCPNGGKWERENMFGAEAKKAWAIFKPTFDAVNKHFPANRQLKSGFGVGIFGDAMLVNVFDHKRNLSSFGINDAQLGSNFTYAYSWFVFYKEYGQKVQKQLAAYHIIDEMLQQLEAFRKGEENHKKAALYSAHDYNIYAILAAFGVITEECIMTNFLSSIANETLPYPNCHFPWFASNLMIELYNQTDNSSNVTSAYVKMLYNEAPLALCDGKEVCEYSEFVKLAREATGYNTEQSYKEKCGIIEPKIEKIEDSAPLDINLNITEEKTYDIDLNITEKTYDIELNITEKTYDIDLNITEEEKTFNIDLNITEEKTYDIDLNITEKTYDIDLNITEEEKTFNIDLNITEKTYDIDLNIIEEEKKSNIDMDITDDEDMGFLGIPQRFEEDQDDEDERELLRDDSGFGISKRDADLAKHATTSPDQGNQDAMIKLLVAATLMVAIVILIAVVIKKSSTLPFNENERSPKKQARYNKLTEIKIH